jgi:transposase-like protein
MFNVNDYRAMSFVEYLKPYQLTFNAFMHTLKKAFAKHKGSIPVLNSSMIPDGWTMDQFMYFAEEVGWAVQDPFNEGKKGAALGKLAGNIGQTQTTITSDQSGIIQSTLLMLNFLKQFIDEASGVTPQRKGAIDNRETVGGVERSVTQSSLNTEKYFVLHDDTKIRVIRALIETAKIAWKDKKFRRSFVLDDMSQGILDFDGESFLESDYGVYISISPEHQDMFRNLRNLSQAFMQNGGTLSMVANLYTTTNPVTLQKKLEKFEEGLKEAEENARKEELQVQQAAIQQKEQSEAENRRIEEEKNIRDAEVEIYKANLDKDINSQEPIEVNNELDKIKLDEKKHQDNIDLKNKDLNEKIRHNKETEKISKQKPKPTSK